MVQFTIIMMIIIRTLQQKTHTLDLTIVIVCLVIGACLFIVFKVLSMHRMMVQVSKLVQTLFLIVLLIVIRLIIDNVSSIGDVYALTIAQYLFALMKIYMNQIIKQRIRMKHYYDDVLIMSSIVYLYDYIILMKFTIIKDLSLFRQIVLVVNFIVIQTRSILNINVFYQIFKYCLRRRLLIILNIPSLLVYLQFFKATLEIVYQHILTYFIVIIIKGCILLI